MSELDMRTLVFNHPKGDSIMVTIKGTSVVPEFSSSILVAIVMVSSIIGTVTWSRWGHRQKRI